MAAKAKHQKQTNRGRNKNAPSSMRRKNTSVKKQNKQSRDTKKQSSKKQIKHIRLPISRSKYLKLTLQTTKRTKRTKKDKKNVKSIPALIILIGLAGTAYYSFKIYNGLNLSPPAPVAAQAEIIPAVPPVSDVKSLPRSNASRLLAPAIDLDAPVNMVGREADGTLEVPNSFDVAGQYKFAPTPGEIGPAVIAGHVDSISGPAIFANIYKLKPGNKIIVKRKDGSSAKFKVTKVQNYEQSNFPVEDVYGNTSNAQLRLITCGGTFNLLTQRYSENTVVYASLI